MKELLTPLNLVAFLTVVTMLVAAHELGHYLFARLFKMEVEEFAVGFGRPRWVFWRKLVKLKNASGGEDQHETEYSLRAWPIGGFVRIKGMEPHEDGSEVNVAHGFYSKPPIQRIVVLFAGPLFSVLAGWLLLIPLWSTVGRTSYSEEPVIGSLAMPGPGSNAGLKAGDRILSADGTPTPTFYDVVKVVRANPAREISVEFERGGKRFETVVTPEKDATPTAVLNSHMEPTGASAVQGKIGAMPKPDLRKLSVGEATREAALMPIKLVDNVIGIARNMFRFEREVGGPITMFAATAGALERGIVRVLEIAGLLSISLGIFNLMPFPPFDGGQMLVAFAEMLRRGRRLAYGVQNAIAGFGLLVMVSLILSVFVVDIRRFFVPQGNEPKAPAAQPLEPKPKGDTNASASTERP